MAAAIMWQAVTGEWLLDVGAARRVAGGYMDGPKSGGAPDGNRHAT